MGVDDYRRIQPRGKMEAKNNCNIENRIHKWKGTDSQTYFLHHIAMKAKGIQGLEFQGPNITTTTTESPFSFFSIFLSFDKRHNCLQIESLRIET